jgi:hypothetical protein
MITRIGMRWEGELMHRSSLETLDSAAGMAPYRRSIPDDQRSGLDLHVDRPAHSRQK